MRLEIRMVQEKEFNLFIESLESLDLPAWDRDLVSILSSDSIGAFIDGELVGVIKNSIKNEINHINSLFVSPKYRHVKIATQLINYIESFNSKYITAHPFTSESEQFFLAIGFVIDENFYKHDTNTVVKTVYKLSY